MAKIDKTGTRYQPDRARSNPGNLHGAITSRSDLHTVLKRCNRGHARQCVGQGDPGVTIRPVVVGLVRGPRAAAGIATTKAIAMNQPRKISSR
jgi:hypothetical protein